MQDRTIDNALLALRKQIVLADGKGQEQVEALLAMRGVPLPGVRRRGRPPGRWGQISRLVLTALSDGPMTLQQLTDYVDQRMPLITREDAYKRVATQLSVMKAQGLVRHGRKMWKA